MSSKYLERVITETETLVPTHHKSHQVASGIVSLCQALAKDARCQ